jgi:YihY family inner membrane protein
MATMRHNAEHDAGAADGRHPAEQHQEQKERQSRRTVEPIERHSPPGHAETGWKRWLNALQGFWTKATNDWIFNLSAMLAYTLLMSIFPLLLVLLAVAGFVLAFAGGTRAALESAIIHVLPPGVGAAIVPQVLENFTKSAGVFAVIGIVTAAYAGSRLFIAIASCFSIIFRLRPRNALRQNEMAFGMTAIFIVLVPFIFLASSIANTVAGALFHGAGGVGAFLIRLAGLGVALFAALILFAAIYVVVPNRPVHINEVWQGTLTAGVLLMLYELVFPLYQSLVLKPGNYGAVAGFAIVILVFFYYFAFILLLGAEVNSWAAGQRETAADIPSIIHEVEAHDTTRGAAGPTAGTPEADLQGHQGAAAMRNNQAAIEHERVAHKGDEKPPKFAAANSPNPALTAAAAEHTTGYNKNRPTHRPEPGKQGSDASEGGADGRQVQSEHQSAQHQDRQPERTHRRSPSRREQPQPLSPAVRDVLEPKRRGSSGPVVIAAVVTAALPVVMWLLGRQRAGRPA